MFPNLPTAEFFIRDGVMQVLGGERVRLGGSSFRKEGLPKQGPFHSRLSSRVG